MSSDVCVSVRVCVLCNAGGAWRQLQASAARSEPPSGSLPANQRQLPQQAQLQQAKQQQQQQRASGGAQCGAGNGGGSGPAPPANPQVREQLRRQQQYAGAQKQAAPSASPPQLAQQQAVPASAAPASQQPAGSRGLLAPAVEELFARVQGDKGLQVSQGGVRWSTAVVPCLAGTGSTHVATLPLSLRW